MTLGDVGRFHRLARLYDAFAPSLDAAELGEWLGLADRDVAVVLDVGGGSGRAARAVDAPTTVVVDAARGMVDRARARGLTAVLADGGCLPVREDAVDAVVIYDALHHMADRAGVVSEAARVLRPGGVLVVREFDPTTLRGRALATAEHLAGFDSTFVAADELAGTVAAAGLDTAVPDRGFGYTVVGVAR
ncbi:methyltransferase type 11 [Halobacteriales archaeon QS_1_68_17]|nr:MAG: methyltransferase type 11 [Halobacteriales archaeon QS_1_68_17]